MCFVKGGSWDRCTDVADGYVHGEWLDAPDKATLDKWRQMTDDNDHSEVRREISGWLENELYKVYRSSERYRRACDFYRVFTAIKVIHDEVGHLFIDLCTFRYEKTEQLIAFIREMDPEAADAINDTL